MQMKLVQVITELRFLGILKPLKPYSELHLAVLGEEPKEPEKWPALGVEFKDVKRKIKTLVESKRCAISLEYVPNLGYCRQTIAQTLKRIDDILEIPLLQRVGVRSVWIEASEMGFEELLTKYRASMLIDNSLSQQCVDLGVVLDLIDEESKIRLLTGPMKLEQLKAEYLSFEAEDLPVVFACVDMDYFTTRETKYSDKFLNEFLDRALTYSSERGEEVVNIVLGS